MKTKRINGLDLAIGASIPLMLFFGFFLEIGMANESFSRDRFTWLFDGSVAVFLFYAGLTAGFSASLPSNLRSVRRYLVRRGVLFLFVGLLLSFLWPSNLFTTLGLVSLLGAVLILLQTSLLRTVIVLFFLASLYTYTFVQTSTDLAVLRLSKPEQVVQNILYEGYYAFLPWVVFFLSGMSFSRNPILHGTKHVPALALGGASIVAGLMVELLFSEGFFQTATKAVSPCPELSFASLLLPSFILVFIGIGIVSARLALARNTASSTSLVSRCFQFIAKTKYSLLLLQASAGILASLRLGAGESYAWTTLAVFTLVVLGISAGFLFLWVKRFGSGPVEQVLRAMVTKK